MKQVNLYVKGLSSNSVNGFLLQESPETTFRIQVRLKIDSQIYNEFIEQLSSPYLCVMIDEGMIVGVKNRKGEMVGQQPDIEDKIIDIVRSKKTISKKELFALLRDEFKLSHRTLQRKIKEMLNMIPELRGNYNNLWYKEKW